MQSSSGTRHSSHASLTAAALRAGKAGLVEKPLALDADGLAEVEQKLAGGGRSWSGFNRRFAPLTVSLRRALEQAPGRNAAKELVMSSRSHRTGRHARGGLYATSMGKFGATP
jgi:predicted dehydrogenase